jgi:hypothetical protein
MGRKIGLAMALSRAISFSTLLMRGDAFLPGRESYTQALSSFHVCEESSLPFIPFG